MESHPFVLDVTLSELYVRASGIELFLGIGRTCLRAFSPIAWPRLSLPKQRSRDASGVVDRCRSVQWRDRRLCHSTHSCHDIASESIE